MDAQVSSLAATEEGNKIPSSGTSLRQHGSRGDGAGLKKSGGHQQRWMAVQAGVSSTSSRSNKEKVGANSNGTGGKSSRHRGPASSSLNNTTPSSKKSFRAFEGHQRNDPKPNDNIVHSSPDDNKIAYSSGAFSIPGVHNVHTKKAETRFVPYLPQDDAVVAGLGERNGGVDASETQQAIDLLNEQLHKLLLLSPRQFLERVNSDETLGVFLDSYLHFKRRWFDKPLRETDVGAIAGDGELSRRVFMVLLRMASSEDCGNPADTRLSAKDLSSTLLGKKPFFDVPKLMDIVAIYGHDNPDLTRRLVGNAFQAQPKFPAELAADIPCLLERITTTYNRCLMSIEATKNPLGTGIAKDEATRIRGELLEVVDFFNDVAITLRAFVETYPPSAEILISSGHEQGTIFFAMVNIHDTLVPNLLEALTVLEASSDVSVATRDILHNLPNNLGDLAWKLLECRYIDRFCGKKSEAFGAVHVIKTDEDTFQTGDDLLSTIVALAEGSASSNRSMDENQHDTGTFRSSRKGGLLCNIERRHKLSAQILQAGERGALLLSEQLQHKVLKVLSDVMSENINESAHEHQIDERRLLTTYQVPSELTSTAEDLEKETAIQQSKISQVKDLFPDFGDGFIMACLEAYDDDPEKLIQKILEGTLHSDLLALGTTLLTRPDKASSQPPSRDKGKGKIIDQPEVSNGKVVWEKRSSRLHSVSGSSHSSLPGNSSSSAQHVQAQTKAGSDSNAETVGRYVRRQQQESGSLNELLDRRDEDEGLRASIRAAVGQFEYEDEYDDSFDELNEYLADAGGNEEAESLADQIAGRGRAQQDEIGGGGGGGRRHSDSGRPVTFTPWGSDMGKGRDRSSGPLPKPKFETQKVVPEGDNLSMDQPLDPSAGHGRGGGMGDGRGRKKWKDQGPKPNFYLKEGKLYSYKVAGAVGVASIDEAEAMKREEDGLVHGLGAGGNVPLQQQESTNGSAGTKLSSQSTLKAEQGRSSRDAEKHYHGAGEGGRGRGAGSHGKETYGRGLHRGREDNYRRKDQAMKKHFGGVGGF